MKEPDTMPPQGEDLLDPTAELIPRVLAALDAGDGATAIRHIESLHYSEAADLLERLPDGYRRRLVTELGGDLPPDALSALADPLQEEVVDLLPTEELAAVVSGMDSDDAVDLVEVLDADERRDLLEALPADDRVLIEGSLAYPEFSAGRLMRRELVAVPEFWTVGECIDHLRNAADKGEDDGALPEDFYDVYVVDPRHHPTGILPLNRLLTARRPVPLADLKDPDVVVVPADMDQEEVAFLFSQRDLVSAPVIDASGRLVGTITIDDVVDVIHEEQEEDVLRLHGVWETDLFSGVLPTARARFSWLLVNLGTAVLASMVIGLFDATLDQMVALAVLMPIVASMGGNAGTQTLTIAVRALATHDLTPLNAWRVVAKEMAVAMLNGSAFALLSGIVAWLWFGDPMLGGVIATAMVFNMLVAGLAGAVIPVGLDRLGVDPAVASTVFLTTVTDVVGFFSFLGLAAWVLI